IRPLKFVIPTFGHATRGPEAFFVALKLYDLLTVAETKSAIPQQAIPSGQVISKRECLDLIPGLELRGITGGAVWYDGQMLDSDRVLLECV
ncbi:hypothetical protein, partial [Halalkalibacter flavus]|uniref:hypothetical protein n=1 Tax=Halalkalibacter flavus TaxID=3090668 RepID=UPI002FC91933